MSLSILLKRLLLLLAVGLLLSYPAQAQQKSDLSRFKNYVKAKEQLHTCGAIEEDALAMIKAQGIKMVISLNTESPSKVVLMKQKAKRLDIQYLHVPVSWKKPSLESLEQFFNMMDAHPKAEILVHCRLNWRASAFVYLYRTIRLKEDEATARAAMHQVWNPWKNKTWSRFFDEAFEKFH